MSQTAGWYTDPTGDYSYRYWDGLRWTAQVNSGGNTRTDPQSLDPQVAKTPPAPGTAAPEQSTSAAGPTPPTVQVTQGGGGSMSPGTLIVTILAVVAIVILLFVLLSGIGDTADDAPAEDSPATEQPADEPAPADTPADEGT